MYIRTDIKSCCGDKERARVPSIEVGRACVDPRKQPKVGLAEFSAREERPPAARVSPCQQEAAGVSERAEPPPARRGSEMSGLLALLLLLLPPPAGGSVEVNAGMEVARGRSAFLAKEQLRIRTGAGDLCKVEVVLNQPITQRVGRLTPQVFDCDFPPEEVAYRHNGSPLLDSDQVLLRVYRLGPAETHVELVVLRVRVVDRSPRLADLGPTPLVVPDFYALSNAIDRSVVNIEGRDGAACAVRLAAAAGALTAGRLVRERHGLGGKGGEAAVAAHCPGNRSCAEEVTYLKTSCQDFLSSGLKYQHLSPPSPDLDHIAITVELRDRESGAPLETESLWLPVRIVGATPNRPPRAAFMASFILEVDRFVLTPITTATLDAEDPEGPRDGLLFNVTVPPPRGYVTHLDERTKPVGSFSWSDLHHLKVAYQPPNVSRPARDNFQMEFRAVDASHATSPPIVVDVSIRAAETDAPRVSWNTGLDLLEGQSRAITWAELQIVDRDNIDDVVLVAVDGPAHGRLTVKGAKAFAFGARDLRSGHVAYQHSDDESTRDHVVFRISDGRHSSRHKFPINILPRDDAPPFLVNNVALEVPEGGALRLRPADLLASDPDSPDARILFRVDVPPRAGRLVSRADPRDPGLPVTSFLQRDLTGGLIFYQHSGEEIFEDSFEVTLADAHAPPNLSQAYTVAVAVFPVDDGLPVEADGSVRRLTLKETQVAFITRAHLHFTHSERPGAHLTYTITRPCHSPRRPGLMDAGRLFLVDGAAALKRDPTAPALKSFTQHAVDHLKVAYMPPLEDIGPDPLAVRFVFSVSDRRGGAVADLDFNITVTPVDDQPPEAFVNLLRVEEGGAAFVTDEHVLVRDRDTREPDLKVALERPARRGRLELRGRSLRPGDAFTLADLRGLAVRYVHDDSESSEDDVGLRVTDGVNSVLLDLQIHVLAVNDEPPQLGAGLRGGLRCPEGGRVQLTADYLLATDRDSEDAQLSYALARRPARGELQRAGLAVDKFSQEDLLRGLVFYVHTGGEIGPAPSSDTVTLIVSDGDAVGPDGCCPGDAPPVPPHKTLPAYDLDVTLLPVNNKVPSVILGGSALAVDEGSWACLCGGILGAWDADSPPAELTFHLDAKPLHGFLENVQPTPGYEKSNAGVPIESFKLDEVASGFINYVQSEHEGAEPTEDRLLISVSDGLHRSASAPVRVLINPANDEKPSLRLADFSVKEGGARELTPSLLDAFDLDAPADELTFSLAGAPAHGGLRAGPSLPRDRTSASPAAVTSFTLRQLRQGLRVWYAHDDSETLEDRLSLRLSDGVHSLSASAVVSVLPVDDHPPRLLKNAGAQAEPGERRLLSAVVLQAEDADTPPPKLFYLLHAAPRFGRLQLESPTGPTALAAGHNFTQDDVDANRLNYTPRRRGDGDDDGEFRGHDSFRFSLSDLEHQSSAHTFSIAISGARKGNVSVWTGAVRVASGQRVLLNTDFLRAQDGGGRPDRLVYTVTAAPRHGLLHAAARPGVPLATFTQMDVAAQRVCYTHDNGQLHRSDAFSFVVSNGERSQAGTLRLSIETADRVPPTLEVNAGARVRQGGTVTIGAEVLRLSDAGTPASSLTFALSEPPRYGRLLLRGVPLGADVFTQADVDGRRLAYRHDDPAGRGLNDSFRFLPGDGRNRGYLRDGRLRTEPAVFAIHVERVDRSPPILTTLGRPSEVIRLRDGRQALPITSEHLRAADDHSPPDGLQFAVVTPPRFGHLENIRTGAYVRGRFTQRDLQRRSLVFVVPADADVTEDSLVFRLSDPAGNAAPPQTLHLSWSRIELSASCFRICETAGRLQVQIQRRGKSADPAYVAIQVRDGSAKAARDFTHSTAGLIQFDPGVDRKTWSIYPEADGLEENDEDFTVTLQDPKNAVLGRRTSARVEIVDPRGGRCDLSKGGQAEAPPPSAVATPPPAVTAPPTAVPDADAEAERFFGETKHPPRGDVPNRRPFAGEDDEDDSPAEPQDRAHPGHTDERVAGKAGLQASRVALEHVGKVGTFHSLSSLRLEEVADPQADGATERHGPGHAPPAGSRKREAESLRSKTGRSPSGRCEVGWTRHGGRCYLAGSTASSWASAERSCSVLLSNSSLPSVRSRRQLGWLWRFGGEKPFWIGRSEVAATRPGLPSAFRAPCLLAESSSRWTSGGCDAAARHAFICEAPPSPR
ncbi:FRAS1-related extracellular matrix protein 1b isoform X2 [Hippocampus zosterae]|uniref:FRAS1-related extracellular matrix protein 1b isoform X2 n=1 Tax=Hippocampus zosterae TaxID=109293 RepID=UPI00223CFCFC|nr:FRAS1-related extracellular matrix protein 1b isoform X2 [Hippocampus zosterae]